MLNFVEQFFDRLIFVIYTVIRWIGLLFCFVGVLFAQEPKAQKQAFFEYSDSEPENGATHRTCALTFTGDALRPEALSSADSLVEFMNQHPEILVCISVHLDQADFPDYEVSQPKPDEIWAEALKKYLVKKGINSHRIVANGKGFYDPIHTFNTIQKLPITEQNKARQQNRRVEITIIGILSSN